MSNVEKLKKKAADFEAKRQIDKAIATYLDLFRVWDTGDIADVDVALYNRVGDLLLREGNVGDAMSVWEKAVDYYGESGFHNNAIALCNKILRHSPGRTSIYYKLGKISAQKGFKGDAKKNYLEYADRMQKSNNMDEAFRALKEFADLCPDEDDIRQMLADQLSKAGKKAEAVEQLQVLYDRYEDAGDSDAAAATVERMKALDPSIEPKRGDGTRQSKESSGLVFIDLDAPAGRASRRSTTAVPQPPAPPPRQSKAAAAPPPAAPPPAPPKAAKPPAAPPPAPRKTAPSKKLTGDIPLIDLDDEPPAPPPVAQVEGLEVAPQVPQTPAPAEGDQLDVTFGASFGTEDADVGDTKPLAGLESTSFSDPPSTGGRVTASLSSAADTTFGTLGTDDLTLADSGPLGVGDPVFNTPAETVESIAPATPTPPPANVIPDPMPELTFTDATETIEPAAEPAPTFDGGSLPLMDLEVAAEPAAAPEAPRRSARSTMSVLAQSVDLLRDRVANEPNNWQAHRELGEAMLEDGDRTGGLDQLESAMVGFESEDDLESARSLADEIIRLNPHSIRHHQKRVEYAVRMGDRPRLIEAYIELADALFRAGQADKAKSVYQRVLELAPDDVRALAALETFGEPEEVAPPAPPADARRSQHAKRYTAATPIENLPPVPSPPKAAASSGDYVDLEDWLKEDDAPKSTRMVVEEKEPTGDEDADFADMLRKFKQGVAENVDEEDHESHYDLGVAYKEMGLVDEAIAEFQKALRGAHNRVRAYEALGQCFVERGQDQVALTILQRALAEPGVTDEQLVGVLYLLGSASEALKHPADAVKYYQRIFAVDIKFRDVQKRMRALEAAAR
ncbi:MAG TPA: tetratricopeptide repeat protein [Gemmatimonadaceae bacterium]|nr:tetratricopeptide repeat protein [Gemmatimonadaceae bacterium]